MTADQFGGRYSGGDRARGAIAAGLVCAALGYALIVGLAVRMPGAVDDGLALFAVPPEKPRAVVKTVPPKVRSHRPEGAAAPPNLRSKATEIVAPPPEVVIVVPPLVIAAPKAGIGAEASAGAANIVGPGSGSGGEGDGTGGGGNGDGDGGGLDDETPPRQIRGRLSDADYPRELGDEDIGGTVAVRYVVETNGRVRDCRATRSSGSAVLDALTCRLITERFRFKPSLDRLGRPVAAVIVENHSWVVEDLPAEAGSNDRRRRR